MKKYYDKNSGKKIWDILIASSSGVVLSLFSILIFAFIIKLTGLKSNYIMPINQFIKTISILCCIIVLTKRNNEKIFTKSIIVGIVYTLLTFIIFSLMSGNFTVDKSIINDCLFSIIISLISGFILKIIKK